MHLKIATILIGIIAISKISAIVWGAKAFENLLKTDLVFGISTEIWFVIAAFGLLLYNHYKKSIK